MPGISPAYLPSVPSGRLAAGRLSPGVIGSLEHTPPNVTVAGTGPVLNQTKPNQINLSRQLHIKIRLRRT